MAVTFWGWCNPKSDKARPRRFSVFDPQSEDEQGMEDNKSLLEGV